MRESPDLRLIETQMHKIQESHIQLSIFGCPCFGLILTNEIDQDGNSILIHVSLIFLQRLTSKVETSPRAIIGLNKNLTNLSDQLLRFYLLSNLPLSQPRQPTHQKHQHNQSHNPQPFLVSTSTPVPTPPPPTIMLNVAIVGANGGMGLALIRAFYATPDVSVIAVLRNQSKLPIDARKQIHTIVEGDATQPDTVQATLSHSPDIVIIAVGSQNTKVPQTIRADVTRAYVDGMRDTTTKLLVVSAVGAGMSGMQTNWFMRTFLLGMVLKHPMQDHSAQETIVRDGLPVEQWLIVRPTELNDNPSKGVYEVQETNKLRSTRICRDDLAKFIVKQVKGEGKLYWGKMVAVTW